MKYPAVHYHDYLKLNQLLSSQSMRSEELGAPAHDELLFITVHQTYELWFKQIIFELDSVLSSMQASPLPERTMGTIVLRLERILAILRLSLGNIEVLETMTPLDFLDFRDMLYPASGFQSFQFRLIETKLGLKEDDRLLYNKTSFHSHLPEQQRDLVLNALKSDSLLGLIEKWLERTPFLQANTYNFWKDYQSAVFEMLAADRQVVGENSILPPEVRERNIKLIELTEATFKSLFDEEAYEKLRKAGEFKMSLKALQAALFIQVYRDEPILQQPFRILSALTDLDEVLTSWRYRHAQMVQRMLGRKIGTGGSSGHDYLKDTADRHRIFSDLTRLATYLIPRSKIPNLPTEIRERMDYSKVFPT